MGTAEVPPRSKLYATRLTFSGQQLSDLRKRAIDCGVEIARSAEYGISGITTPTRLKSITLVGVTLAYLGLRDDASNEEAWKSAAAHGLVAPPQETALELVSTPGVNFSKASNLVVMSHAIQSLARRSDSILLGVVDKGTHRILVGEIGAPRWRVTPNKLLVFMQKQET